MVKSSSRDQRPSEMEYLYRFFFVLFQPTVYKFSSIWKTIVEKLPTVGKSAALSIVFLDVLKINVALVLFCLSNPPKIRMFEGLIW